ncbi:ATG8-interacting protein 1-like isoform X1 [Salvia miltiorrhiza]|uniref:ATG8-interacting protein 1-like isoform X1 n=1 Tax=Salvia miltiorrhiza TaxID=226208 RepID=UPI0025ABFAFE|nr:ATG8-interacting protein 1-like isoform X1 [Salvia miltiorrhiza]XP_057766452.1 ATG8-interacting protein 1-like isoform X1 [Salvia miltiorrhiza]XP_057766453.1 ATG8-interacting protein 1-like isoform X1 [Salvia miltiorrhiza]XP_057766456.1 ATG8-interacting protein 1-like isoform X1 [Salvia miltiorrhiza]XP_057766457.1 ATG8-interacting protein 1-like isoform X1 [Salvia miltiorrhiza]XP_057766458.1 ATG8-interacting protein 1-like isoform X1 [Salvia miltiorrhiza]XP_057766459.1 ATG8-interacting pro
MADNEEAKETGPRGNEWEVVSLTASAYAAAPGPKPVDSSQDSVTKLDKNHEGETSNAMFMSSHFVFPPSQHENLPIEPEFNESDSEKGREDDVSQLGKDEGVKSDAKDEDNATIEGLMTEEFPGIQVLNEKGNTLSLSGADLRKDVGFDRARSIYTPAEFSLFSSETTMGISNNSGDGAGTDDSIEPLDGYVDPNLLNFQKPIEGDKYDDADLPCEAWWKRRAFSVYAHAKEANTVWSIFLAAAVMGLVIIGHQWQHERWQVLRLRWQFGINDERMSRLLAPIFRLKDVVVGGHRRGSLVRGSTSSER